MGKPNSAAMAFLGRLARPMKAKDLAPKDVMLSKRDQPCADASVVMGLPEDEVVHHLILSVEFDTERHDVNVTTVCGEQTTKLNLWRNQIVLAIDGGQGDPYR